VGNIHVQGGSIKPYIIITLHRCNRWMFKTKWNYFHQSIHRIHKTKDSDLCAVLCDCYALVKYTL